LSQKISSGGWHPGPSNLGQNGLIHTPLMASPTKNQSKTLHLKKIKLEDLPHCENSSSMQDFKVQVSHILAANMLTRPFIFPVEVELHQLLCTPACSTIDHSFQYSL